MFKGPIIDHICLECGANNSITGYVEFYDCYACGRRINFKDGIKKYLKQKFPEGAEPAVKKNKTEYADNIFNSLNLTEADRKYIYVEKERVCFSFPLKLKTGIWVGGKKITLDIKDEAGIYEKVGEFFASELSQAGFKTRRLGNGIGIGEIDFYKDICSTDEAKEAVKRLIEFKKRFGF